MIKGAEFTVYYMQNRGTKRMYYGRTHQFDRRIIDHLKEMSAGEHYNKEMNKHHKYGWDAGVIAEGLTQADANKLSDLLAKEDESSYNILGTEKHSPRRGGRKLTKKQVEQIRTQYFDKGTTQNDLAKKFKVSQSTISLIITGLVHNEDGSFEPPPFVPRPRKRFYAPGKTVADLRDEFNAILDSAESFTDDRGHTRKMTRNRAATLMAQKYGGAVSTILYIIESDDDEKLLSMRVGSTSNLNHGFYVIDGVRYKSYKFWQKQNPGMMSMRTPEGKNISIPRGTRPFRRPDPDKLQAMVDDILRRREHRAALQAQFDLGKEIWETWPKRGGNGKHVDIQGECEKRGIDRAKAYAALAYYKETSRGGGTGPRIPQQSTLALEAEALAVAERLLA